MHVDNGDEREYNRGSDISITEHHASYAADYITAHLESTHSIIANHALLASDRVEGGRGFRGVSFRRAKALFWETSFTRIALLAPFIHRSLLIATDIRLAYISLYTSLTLPHKYIHLHLHLHLAYILPNPLQSPFHIRHTHARTHAHKPRPLDLLPPRLPIFSVAR